IYKSSLKISPAKTWLTIQNLLFFIVLLTGSTPILCITYIFSIQVINALFDNGMFFGVVYHIIIVILKNSIGSITGTKGTDNRGRTFKG
ncbi:MAG: hypothetical protein UE970_03915, partial [Catenibacillus sp.]|nr:hypothetical protein [Catenibacillus sp.]